MTSALFSLRRVTLLALVLAALTLWGCASSDVSLSENSSPPPPESNALTEPVEQEDQQLPIEGRAIIGENVFDLEIARTGQEQQLGLMFRDPLPEGQGMLFPFQPARPASFWMFNVTFDLDIIFIADGEVVYIAASVPGCAELPCPGYGPPRTVLVDNVLELNGGTAAEIGLVIGDTVVLEEL